ncbi:IS110 family transposase [Roseomonas sp. GCM10028921]
MERITTIGLDLAKNVFQVHGVDAGRAAPKAATGGGTGILCGPYTCDGGHEACGGAHFWARELGRLGHEARLMPPAYVKPYVKRGKTDAADAEAICEAVTRPSMRFVPVKTEAQQAAAVELKTPDLLVRQRTQTVNALCAHLSEYGIIAAQGAARLADLVAVVRDAEDRRLPDLVREVLLELVGQVEDLEARIERLDRRTIRRVRGDETASRLATIPGVGAITAAALQGLVPDPRGFRSARHFAAWLGLTPRPHSSGGKERLGRISKQGNPTLRRLLVLGATARLRHARRDPEAASWAARLLARRPFKVAAVALANKMARIAWALLAKEGCYRMSPASV